jgi:hypothetical protein
VLFCNKTKAKLKIILAHIDNNNSWLNLNRLGDLQNNRIGIKETLAGLLMARLIIY